jgi:hypothetical protein
MTMKSEMTPALLMNLLGAPASRRPVGSRNKELAGETPALPGTMPRFMVRASVNLSSENVEEPGVRTHWGRRFGVA